MPPHILNSLLLKKVSHCHLGSLSTPPAGPWSREGKEERRDELWLTSAGRPLRMLCLAVSQSRPSGTCFSPTKAKSHLLILRLFSGLGSAYYRRLQKKETIGDRSFHVPFSTGLWSFWQKLGSEGPVNHGSQWFSAGPTLPPSLGTFIVSTDRD